MAKPRLPSEGHVAEGSLLTPDRTAIARRSTPLVAPLVHFLSGVVQHRLTVAMIHSSVSATDPGPPLWGTSPYIMCPPNRQRAHIDPLKERERAACHPDRTPG